MTHPQYPKLQRFVEDLSTNLATSVHLTDDQARRQVADILSRWLESVKQGPDDYIPMLEFQIPVPMTPDLNPITLYLMVSLGELSAPQEGGANVVSAIICSRQAEQLSTKTAALLSVALKRASDQAFLFCSKLIRIAEPHFKLVRD